MEIPIGVPGVPEIMDSGVAGNTELPGVVSVDPAVVGAALTSNFSGFCADPAVFGAAACFFFPRNSLQACWIPYNN